MGVTAAVAVAAIGTGYAIYSSEEQRKTARKEMKKQESRQLKSEKEYKQRQEVEKQQAASRVSLMRRRANSYGGYATYGSESSANTALGMNAARAGTRTVLGG